MFSRSTVFEKPKVCLPAASGILFLVLIITDWVQLGNKMTLQMRDVIPVFTESRTNYVHIKKFEEVHSSCTVLLSVG